MYCQALILCDENIVDTGGACPTCGQNIDVLSYERLRKVVEDRATAAGAEKERQAEAKRAEKDAQLDETDEERHRIAEEALAAKQQRAVHEQQARAKRIMDEESARQRAQAYMGQRAQSEVLAPVLEIPRYAALDLWSKIVAIAGWVSIGLGALLTVLALLGTSSGLRAPVGSPAGVGVLSFFFLAAPITGCLALGVVLLGWAQLLKAVRDIAINSWRQVGLLQIQTTSTAGSSSRP